MARGDEITEVFGFEMRRARDVESAGFGVEKARGVARVVKGRFEDVIGVGEIARGESVAETGCAGRIIIRRGDAAFLFEGEGVVVRADQSHS